MASISGQNTSNIDNVDGFYTSQGGGVSINPIAVGAQLYGNTTFWMRSDLPSTYARSLAYTPANDFVKIACNRAYTQVMAITDNGELWYNCKQGTYLTGFTADRTWRRYGSDNDWTDISGGDAVWGAIKGGDYMFMGNGSYRQRGDGSTSSVNGFATMNNSQTWVRVVMGYRHTWLINDQGHAYSSGYGYSYMTGQGITSTVSTFTREKNSLTGLVDVSRGYRCAWLRDSSGNTYFTGVNGQGLAGPQLATANSNTDGPVLASSATTDYVCAELGEFSYHGGCHIDSDGYLRFSGEASSYMRPDNSTTDKKTTSGGYQLTSMGTGWSQYNAFDAKSSTSLHLGVAMKNGALWCGGEDSASLKPNLDPNGTASDDQHWTEVISTGTTCVSQRSGVVVKG